MTTSRLLITALLAASPWCNAVHSRAEDEGPVSLRASLDPLIEHFNAGSGKPRVVALVSSTCGACLFGARAVKASVLEAFPQADLQVSIVWIDMLPTDGANAAAKSAAIFDDLRVRQFHDSARAAGRAIGKDLLFEGAGAAWDIYLFYDAQALWTDAPPEPVEWYHQLSGARRADPARFRAGDDLVVALREATARLLAAGEALPPAQPPPPKRETAAFGGVVLHIDGMKHPCCADAVRAALGSVAGVADARVELSSNLAWVRLDPLKPASPDTLIAALEKAGFTARLPDPSEVLDVPADLLEPGAPACAAPLEIDVLCIPGCPNTDALCANLAEACRSLSVECRIRRTDLTELPQDDPRRAWPSPTALVNGADLLGEPRPAGPALACRIYPGGVPTPARLADRIRILRP